VCTLSTFVIVCTLSTLSTFVYDACVTASLLDSLKSSLTLLEHSVLAALRFLPGAAICLSVMPFLLGNRCVPVGHLAYVEVEKKYGPLILQTFPNGAVESSTTVTYRYTQLYDEFDIRFQEAVMGRRFCCPRMGI
jgi:hypothetical protein